MHTAPFVQRMIITLPHFAGVELLALTDELGLSRLRAWIDGMLTRSSCVASGAESDVTIQSYTRMIAMMKGQAGAKS